MPYYGMLLRVALVRSDVSEENIASIIRVIRIDELGIKLAVTNNRSTPRRNTYMHSIACQNFWEKCTR
jgi:hypothetical protein